MKTPSMLSRVGVFSRAGFVLAGVALLPDSGPTLHAQTSGPQLVDSNLQVRTVVAGLVAPTSMAFLGPNDFLVLEKSSGKVQRVVNGAVHSTVLDLAVNSASERGLLGIALHPDFPANPGVYLFWTESSTGADTGPDGNLYVISLTHGAVYEISRRPPGQ